MSTASVGKKYEQQSANVYLVATKTQKNCQKILEEIIPFQRDFIVNYLQFFTYHCGPVDQVPWIFKLFLLAPFLSCLPRLSAVCSQFSIYCIIIVKKCVINVFYLSTFYLNPCLRCLELPKIHFFYLLYMRFILSQIY